MMNGEGEYTVIVVPPDGEGSRTVRFTPRALRVGIAVAAAAGIAIATLLATWWYFAATAARVPELEREVDRLAGENQRVEQLAVALSRVQREYDKVRRLLGAEGAPADLRLDLLPAARALEEGEASGGAGLSPEIPTSWPLAATGFVTRVHGTGQAEDGRHPGLDIAVAQDSYIRAAGAGVVLEAASDSIYGLYVLIEHGNSGYRSMYGHASRLFVAPGDSVRQNQVIALSGNTGRSTAPHLHFEILQDETPIDPLRLVQQRATS